jgi:hypothetical protein
MALASSAPKIFLRPLFQRRVKIPERKFPLQSLFHCRRGKIFQAADRHVGDEHNSGVAGEQRF